MSDQLCLQSTGDHRNFWHTRVSDSTKISPAARLTADPGERSVRVLSGVKATREEKLAELNEGAADRSQGWVNGPGWGTSVWLEDSGRRLAGRRRTGGGKGESVQVCPHNCRCCPVSFTVWSGFSIVPAVSWLSSVKYRLECYPPHSIAVSGKWVHLSQVCFQSAHTEDSINVSYVSSLCCIIYNKLEIYL